MKAPVPMDLESQRGVFATITNNSNRNLSKDANQNHQSQTSSTYINPKKVSSKQQQQPQTGISSDSKPERRKKIERKGTVDSNLGGEK